MHFNRKKRVRHEELVPAEICKKYTDMILEFVLYDVKNNQALQNFEQIKTNTHCIFSKQAVLWGCRDYDYALSLEGNVMRYATNKINIEKFQQKKV